MTSPAKHRPALSDDTLAFLISVDSATMANAIETFAVRDRSEGYVGGAVQCQFPELGVMVGRALTITMRNAPEPPADRAGYWRMWEALEEMDGPVVITIADVSGTPHRVAYAGEIMATLAQRLGAVGIVTDGALRDVEEVRRLGFHYFMRFPVVSHANYEITSVGNPIVLDGQRIVTGDLLHGDRNGIVVVPDKLLGQLPPAVEGIRTNEKADMEFIRGAGFHLDAYKRRKSYGSLPSSS